MSGIRKLRISEYCEVSLIQEGSWRRAGLPIAQMGLAQVHLFNMAATQRMQPKQVALGQISEWPSLARPRLGNWNGKSVEQTEPRSSPTVHIQFGRAWADLLQIAGGNCPKRRCAELASAEIQNGSRSAVGVALQKLHQHYKYLNVKEVILEPKAGSGCWEASTGKKSWWVGCNHQKY